MFIYKNTSNVIRTLTLVAQNGASASFITLSPGATIELPYPGLDAFVPHLLNRITREGTDISHVVLHAREKAEAPKKQVPVINVSTDPELPITQEAIPEVTQEAIPEVTPEPEAVNVPVNQPEAPAKAPVLSKFGRKPKK